MTAARRGRLMSRTAGLPRVYSELIKFFRKHLVTTDLLFHNVLFCTRVRRNYTNTIIYYFNNTETASVKLHLYAYIIYAHVGRLTFRFTIYVWEKCYGRYNYYYYRHQFKHNYKRWYGLCKRLIDVVRAVILSVIPSKIS